jgi:aarF domain-containing kinase
MPSTLRVDYAHLWLSLIAPSSPSVELDRRKYASRVGNIDATLYPIFQAAITGRAALENSGEDGSGAGSMMDLGERTREEERRLRHAVVGTGDNDGLLGDILSLLRKVPRRMLMVFKVSAFLPFSRIAADVYRVQRFRSMILLDRLMLRCIPIMDPQESS